MSNSHLKMKVKECISDIDVDFSYRVCTKEELKKKVILLEATKRVIGINDEMIDYFVPNYKISLLYFESFKRNLRETLESYRAVYTKRFNEKLRLKSSELKLMMDQLQKESENNKQ